ncbi:MAG: Fic family protein [Actinomycetota bacterium]|nr:Fic family protein [Actinomycetota bacterium]
MSSNEGVRRVIPTASLVRDWHKQSLTGVPVAEPWVAGGFRGEGPPQSQLHSYLNGVNGIPGVSPRQVGRQVNNTFDQLTDRLEDLDGRWAAGERLTTMYEDILRLCAWAHGHWVRIHPFADHNGSTARLLTLELGLRYELPLPLPGKPRDSTPTHGLQLIYDLAAKNQMLGDDDLMVQYLHDSVTSTAPPSSTP